MLYNFLEANLTLDFSKSQFPNYLTKCSPSLWEQALADLTALESGELVNRSENRMVGHYWLRNSDLSPNAEIKQEIDGLIVEVSEFVNKIEAGQILSSAGKPYQKILLIGIGGSALGPQFIARALQYKSKRQLFFFDNTDPEGFEDTLSLIGDLSTTLVLVITKSGGTPETANGWKVAEYAFKEQGLEFARNAVAVTMPDSKLEKIAKEQSWLKVVHLADWVGGRTSIWSAVGLLPFALLGYDIKQMLLGAKDIDALGREKDIQKNPALLLATYWLQEAEGKAAKSLVVLPYSDRLELFSKYLQQLIMESLGKEHDLAGNVVNQGLTVFGNKGSTDQHSCVQQLRSGANNFFGIFIRPLKVNSKYNLKLGENYVSDYLNGFFLGTRQALFENGRNSLTITLPEVNEYYLGALVALFERAVSFYASFVKINAYDQPGVEAGKKAADYYLRMFSTSNLSPELDLGDASLIPKLKLNK